MRRAAGLLFVALALVAGCDAGGVRNEGATGDLGPPRPPEPTSFGGPGPGQPAAPVDVWSTRGLRQALDALQRASGGGTLRMIELVLYPEYAITEARDARRPENVDRYVFRAGTVDAPTPVMLFPGRSLEAETFTRAQVAFEAVPRVLRNARTRIGIEGARATHVIVERDTVFSGGAIVVRVYAGTDRRSGYVEYTASGTFRRVVA